MMSVLSAMAHLLDGLDDAADLVVGVLLEAGIDFHLAGVDAFSSGGSESQAGNAGSRGVSLAFAGMTPSSFCRANVSSRSLSHPWSNLPLYLSAHALGTWCGEWLAPVA